MNCFRMTRDGSLDMKYLRVCAVYRLLDRRRIDKARALELLAQRHSPKEMTTLKATVEIWLSGPLSDNGRRTREIFQAPLIWSSNFTLYGRQYETRVATSVKAANEWLASHSEWGAIGQDAEGVHMAQIADRGTAPDPEPAVPASAIETTTDAVIITGKTYPLRRELRATGAIFDRGELGYVARADNARALAIAEAHGLAVTPYEASELQLTPATGERLRAIRQDRQDRRHDRLLKRADAADRRADKASKRISTHEKDFLRLCEPVKIGHHSQRRHEKLIKRAQDAFFAEGAERLKAQKLRNSAEWIAPAAIKGDAEARRQAKRDAVAGLFAIGDTVACIMFGQGVITRINAKTFTVTHSTRGFTFKLDKGAATLVTKGTGKADLPAHKFKVGDLVTATRGFGVYHGVIARRTSRGYSVEYTTERLKQKQRCTFSENALTLRTE